jgi:hypothetical protein
MVDGSHHAERVDDWLRELPEDLSLDELMGRFESMFGTLWKRAHQTLGEVTLTAILDRVVFLASESHPLASELEIGPHGLSCRKLLGRSREFESEQARRVMRHVTTQFLSLLGNLTAEILTPALHAQLVSASEPRADASARQPPTRRKAPDDEESKS